ncbi:methyltransferase family protein [Arcicella aurantiaca]|uniref:Methyltransferase family protein n=1 Tax=Arcicella aurantiaca TaxID=591202 RepID=A0A316E486_9BACT|nr:class I SAM-dependent methyltransferase [Arcicella aurantiaca]PWK25211.1 methyltransferase family protein [Arcicella aurantiaca]
MENSLKAHWETVFTTKQSHEVSWTQDIPKTSIDLIKSYQLPKTAQIIDIGGGDGKLVDFLLAEGYENISVLDISENALERAKKRLGEKAQKVKWIVSDINDFEPLEKYDVWHDRAAFHFLTTTQEIEKYVRTASAAVSKFMTIGTFSENGPQKCSGLEIKQYSEADLENTLSTNFSKIKCFHENHVTPFDTEQNFLFCSFKRI